jgi:hypothetical protein
LTRAANRKNSYDWRQPSVCRQLIRLQGLVLGRHFGYRNASSNAVFSNLLSFESLDEDMMSKSDTKIAMDGIIASINTSNPVI